MRDAWERWGWVVALAACALFALRMLWGRNAFCGPAEEQCLREWLSATGGWIAVAFAIPTLISLNKQVKIASRANQNNAKISLHKSIALARRAYERAIHAESTIKVMKDQHSVTLGSQATLDDKRFLLLSMLDFVRRAVQDNTLDRFEEEIDVPWYGVASLRNIMDKHIEAMRSQPVIETDGQFDAVLNFYTHAINAAALYIDSCKAVSQDFLKEAQAMMADM